MNQNQADAIALGISGLSTVEQDQLEAWTDEAREAALEARRAKAGGGSDAGADASTASKNASAVSELANKSQTAKDFAVARDAHKRAASLHRALGNKKEAAMHTKEATAYHKAVRTEALRGLANHISAKRPASQKYLNKAGGTTTEPPQVQGAAKKLPPLRDRVG